MASAIFGVSYEDITNVAGGSSMGYLPVDENSFTDSGETPTPLNYSFTMNGGAEVVSGSYSSITSVISNPPSS